MSRSLDTLYRQWLMLSKIPRYPDKISAQELYSKLSSEGYEIDIRTVQRDLANLSTLFSLSTDSVEKTNYWFWSEDSAIHEFIIPQ